MIIVAASSPQELQASKNLFVGWEPVVTGVGKVQASIAVTKAINHFHPDYVIGIGTCKALDESYTIGDIVIAKTVVQYDIDLRRFNLARTEVFNSLGKKVGALESPCSILDIGRIAPLRAAIHQQAVIGTADRFLVSSDIDSLPFLIEELHINAVDMESYAIAAAAHEFGLPWAVVRCISDDARGRRPKSYTTFLQSASRDMLLVAQALVSQQTE